MFKQKLKEKAYKSFDKLITGPSFIKNTTPIKPAPRKNLFIPIFSAALACSVIGAITLTTVLRNNARINNENARIRELEDTYISPFEGKYGIYLSFWQITDMKNPDNQNGILHNYHAVHIVLGEVVEEGWLEFNNTETKETYTPVLNFRGQEARDEYGNTIYEIKQEQYNYATVHFADERTAKIKMAVEENTVSIGNEEWDKQTDSIWGRMPFLGTYKADNGNTIEVKEDATMVEHSAKEDRNIDCYVIKYKKDNISINYTEEVKKNKLVTRQTDIKLVDDKYQFVKDGKTYIRQA
jgi:hypothetical protein